MSNWLKKNKLNLLISVLLLVGLFIRIYFVDKVVVGDLMNYTEWGQRLAENGPKNFYFSEGWYYSIPVYPPVSMWVFSAFFWLNEHRFVLAQMHNLIKFPPSAFIIYFYKWGYIFLLKLLPILADLGISLLIYKLILTLTNNKKKAIAGFLIYLLNPITVFISGVWGQTDSVVALLGLISFLLLVKKKVWLSLPILFLSIYFKPSWAVFGPFYLFCLYILKPKIKDIAAGVLISLALFIITTQPFSDNNVFAYGWKLFRERYPIGAGIDGKASISAFNFQTIFFRLDIDFAHEKLLGIKSGVWGFVLYVVANIYSFYSFAKFKNKLFGLLVGIFSIGFGSFLFMATMLERYFFPAFAPAIILIFVKPKLILSFLISNIILAANILYSFYRRGSDPIYHFFIDNNFFVIRLLSVIQTAIYFYILKMLQFEDGKRTLPRSR